MRFNKTLAEVYKDTQRECTEGKCKKCPYKKSTKLTHSDLHEIDMVQKYEKTEIQVINQDTLLAIEDEIINSVNKTSICGLNMASCVKSGGGVERGSMAQEEELFRRTNYFMTLDNSFHPIKNDEIIYTEEISIVKDEKYKVIKKSALSCAFIASAALKNPTLVNGKYTEKDYEIMCNKIDDIFRLAYLNNHNILVLGALGCGAYNNPNDQVADIFKIYLEKYDKCFKKIIFAVYSIHNDNFDVFCNKLIN
jgi:uncharacterized protein (TIGR02452 family)